MSTRNWSQIVAQSSYDLLFPKFLPNKNCRHHHSGVQKTRLLGHPPCPPKQGWGVSLTNFPRNPRRRRHELRWALEHQAMTRKHIGSGHPNADTTEIIRPMSDGPRRLRGVFGRESRSRRSAMEKKGGHAIDSGQSL